MLGACRWSLARERDFDEDFRKLQNEGAIKNASVHNNLASTFRAHSGGRDRATRRRAASAVLRSSSRAHRVPNSSSLDALEEHGTLGQLESLAALAAPSGPRPEVVASPEDQAFRRSLRHIQAWPHYFLHHSGPPLVDRDARSDVDHDALSDESDAADFPPPGERTSSRPRYTRGEIRAITEGAALDLAVLRNRLRHRRASEDVAPPRR